MHSDTYILFYFSDEVECAFLRIKGMRKVFLTIKLIDNFGMKFDQHRLAVMWIDNKPGIDLCDSKSLHDLTNQFAPGEVSFIFEDREISAVIWHGIKNEGTGFVGEILKSTSLKLQVYLDDFTTRSYVMSSSKLENLKRSIESGLI